MRKIILKRDIDRTNIRHYEVTSRDIPNLSDRRSNARSRSANIVARYQSFNKEKGEVRYNVTSQTKAGRSYTVSFRFKNWNPDMNHLDDEIQHSMKGDIEIDCTCPAFAYQGYKYLATLKGGSIEREVRPPDKTNRDRHGFACKHILKAIDSFNQDFDKFRLEGKGMIKKRSLHVQHKYEGKGNVRRYGRTRNESTASLGEMESRKSKRSLMMRNESKSEDWYVIDDGTDSPYIVNRGEIGECIEELMETACDNACEALQDVLADRGSRSSKLFANAIVEAFNDRPRYTDEDLWITVYRVEQSVIDAFNAYVIDRGEDERVIPDNPTEKDIRKALFDRRSEDLMDFLRDERCEEESYYIPEECLKDNTIRGLVQELSDMD